jgi:hypothetical protein
LRSKNSLILFGLWNACLISGRSLLFYQCTLRVIKLTTQLLCDVTAIVMQNLSNVILSRLNSYIYEVTGDHQCGFRHNKSTTDKIFCIHQILGKEWEYNETVHQLFIDFKKAHDLVRREVLYNIFIEFGVPLKLLRLIKMCLN